jgi:hypothetical protein
VKRYENKAASDISYCSPVACVNKKVELRDVTLAAKCGFKFVHNLEDACE